MSDSSKAVFLSYAREDTDAARRIAEALRSQRVEVWFDQNELRGGDAWDATIRRQISECALFLPIVSATTNARPKGYFRREWKLAVDCTHDLAEHVAFLVPVVIDDTPENGAVVPQEFLRVQWTRLAGGLPTTDFVARVKRLLDPTSAMETGRPRPVQRGEGAASPPRQRMAGVWLLLAAAVLATGLWIWRGRTPATPTAAAAARQSAPPIAEKPAAKLPMDLAAAGGLAKADAKSIAVLPFANLSEDKDTNAFFADGMHDELLAALAKIRDLKVISRTSVLAYRDPAKRNLKQIAAELGVAHILEGSVSRAGNRVRIIVQLIDAATDQHRWAETYNKDVTDVFQVQADISALIAQSLAATLSPEQKVALAHKLTTNPAAYDLYLRGRRWRERDNRTQFDTPAKWEETVVRPLEQAVALDPKFAVAYAELGRIHCELYWLRSRDPVPARLARAKLAIDTALQIEPSLPMAHLALGRYYHVGFLDYARATEEFAIALAAMPGDPDVLLSLANTQRRQGRWTEATANFERAFAVNPRDSEAPTSWVMSLYAQRFFAQAERAAERALVIHPAHAVLLILKANARFARDGDRERRQAALDANRVSTDAEPLRRQFDRAFDFGRYGEAVRIYEEAPEQFERDGRYFGSLAGIRNRVFFALVAGDNRDKVRARALAAIAADSSSAAERRDEWVRVAGLAMCHAYAGLTDDARRLAARTLELMPMSRDAYDGAHALYQVALVHLVLGDHGRALALLDQATSVPNHVTANHLLHFEPWWQPLHKDPRFQAALAKAAPRD